MGGSRRDCWFQRRPVECEFSRDFDLPIHLPMRLYQIRFEFRSELAAEI
jgi:hypothetical protein